LYKFFKLSTNKSVARLHFYLPVRESVIEIGVASQPFAALNQIPSGTPVGLRPRHQTLLRFAQQVPTSLLCFQLRKP